jgi:hypothetical protein
VSRVFELKQKLTYCFRFKIENALTKAGLLHTKYAQDILAGIPTKVRVDQLSFDQREVYLKKNK